jgi:hypothetical protein
MYAVRFQKEIRKKYEDPKNKGDDEENRIKSVVIRYQDSRVKVGSREEDDDGEGGDRSGPTSAC